MFAMHAVIYHKILIAALRLLCQIALGEDFLKTHKKTSETYAYTTL